ncbi:poly [ADP-ribose] polymerase [Phlebotomus argentipes]|uniref:poly [ADP-ribose] polymerase n=1 Tax=Phlebotomus argentipes TaxID=94469 RepID=UPI0028936FB1|nr:poly [ADP-ribose] polymerase [Phlebotomus argentipes]
MDLPFLAEYSKSNRASCRFCKNKIEKGELRIAAMVQSAFHDGKQPNWFHSKCFFEKQRPASEGDIAGFAMLRTKDQEFISKEIAKITQPGASTSGKGKGKKRGASNTLIRDFGVEYSKSDRATCAGCQQKILKGEVRIKKIAYDTEVGMKFGGQPLWHHVECFVQCRQDVGYFTSGDQLPGYNALSKEDKNAVKKALPAVNEADLPVAIKKVKTEKEEPEDKALKKTMKKQNDKFFDLHRLLEERELKKNHLIDILEANKQDVPEGLDAVKNLVCDILVFGALKRCKECGGQLMFNDNGYKCTGNISEWAKCEHMEKEPERFKAKIPKGIVEKFDLKSVKPAVDKRVFKYYTASVETVKAMVKDETDGPKVVREKGKLYNMEFFVIGKLQRTKDDIRAALRPFGGRVGTRIHENTMAVISNEKEVEKMNGSMALAKQYKIQVVPVTFLDEIANVDVFQYITSNSLCDWGADPATRVKAEEAKSKSKSIYEKSVSKSVTMRVKNGSVIDPDSGLEDVAHVYKEKGKQWAVVLNNADVQTSKNSYYKLQLLEADNKRQYWIFRAWGRIGTTIGSNKLSNYRDLSEAMVEFESQYLDKTGNDWGVGKFKKQPGKYFELDIDYGDNGMDNMSMVSDIPSKLDLPVQNLIRMIFDIDAMKKVMLEFELDMDKMPLGKLSEKQIRSAYGVLTELAQMVENGGSNGKFIDASNRFFTLVPHNFGVKKPPILDTVEEIQSKITMLDNLMEIEVAYSLLKGGKLKEASASASAVNPIDSHYDQLKTELVVLDKTSEEFALLAKYVKNTHAETHNLYNLEIEEIFKVKRNGEDRRYKPFKKLHNRRLLWHGSRLTNYAGILSHGLKIAPPEAPITGYMFGKGIYFADMVTKSANYCCTNPTDNTGLMILCEVALGDMEEYTQAKYVTKLASGKHSVKGVGKSFPDPKQSVKREDGVEIPLGKAVKNNQLKNASLLYNEYIVYDAAQVNIQYLFKMNFNYRF